MWKRGNQVIGMEHFTVYIRDEKKKIYYLTFGYELTGLKNK